MNEAHITAIWERIDSIGGPWDYLDRSGTVETVLEEDVPRLLDEIERLRTKLEEIAAFDATGYERPDLTIKEMARKALAHQ